MYIDLNISIKNPVSYVKNMSVGRHTHNSLYSTKINVNYNEKVFPVGECLHATIK